MITGTYALIYTRNANGVRAYFRDVLGLPVEESDGSWPNFALPPAELGVHEADGDLRHELYLTCDDIEVTVTELEGRGARISQPISDQGWGLLTSLRLPGGGEIGLYQPAGGTGEELPVG